MAPKPAAGNSGNTGGGRQRRILLFLSRRRGDGASIIELAKLCSTSTRTASRVMRAMEHDGWPVYIRRSTVDASRWALDLERFVYDFTRKKNWL